MTTQPLDPQAEIIEDKVFSSGFTWSPQIVKTLDYSSIQKKFNFKNTHFILLCGVSTSGKNTLIKKLKESNMDFFLIPRATSRKPRTGKIDGEDYLFSISDSILWSKYSEDLYSIPSKIFEILSNKKTCIMINGIVYGHSIKIMFEKLGIRVTIVYTLPGKLTDSLEVLQHSIQERIQIRDNFDKRLESVMNELHYVLLHKDFLIKEGVVFIENQTNKLGYSPDALTKLQSLI